MFRFGVGPLVEINPELIVRLVDLSG